jgi:DNA-directed RNA polymerase specialized sigma24 family protein
VPGDADLPQAVEAARRGDQQSWDVLVARFTPLLWAVARGHGLPASAAADVAHTTWLRLVESLDDAPADAVGEWVAAIARAEAMQALRWVDPRPERRGDRPAQPLQLALDRLPARCRLTLRVLAVSPPPDANELAAVLDVSPDQATAFARDCLQRLAEALTETASIQGA